jgi:hypothetical protein
MGLMGMEANRRAETDDSPSRRVLVGHRSGRTAGAARAGVRGPREVGPEIATAFTAKRENILDGSWSALDLDAC